MATHIDIGELHQKSYREQIYQYAEALPDGKAVPIMAALKDMGIPYSSGALAAKRTGCTFQAHLNGVAGGVRAMLANPRTVKLWHDAQKKLPPRKR